MPYHPSCSRSMMPPPVIHSTVDKNDDEEFSREVDSSIWRACAGNSVRIPPNHSRVYYFPQGHLEQSHSSSLANTNHFPPFFLCRVLSLRLYVDLRTDQVFSRFSLRPITASNGNSLFVESSSGEGDDRGNRVVSFAKVLTPSDANNGGGFSVPRFCADSIFPPLDFNSDPPVQTLKITDLHGVTWEFRHIYRGTPRRHLLTTGWSKFVNNKKLIAGDSVVFMRDNESNKLHVGVRRVNRRNGLQELGMWAPQGSGAVKQEDEGMVFGNGTSGGSEVEEAIELAKRGMPFDVVYYPRGGGRNGGWGREEEFVIDADAVEEAMGIFWTAGIRVKMPVETEDSSRITWFQGTVSSTPENGPRIGSPWRMLQITWDEPEVLHNVKKVSPWQVEYVVPTPTLQTACPPLKKLRGHQRQESLTGEEGQLFHDMKPRDTMIGQFSPSLLNYNAYPAGMQGARHNPFSIPRLSNLVSQDLPGMRTDVFGDNMSSPLKILTTDLNIVNSQSDEFSPDSYSSVHSFNKETGNQGCKLPSKVGISSIQLFGKIIYMNEPVESSYDGAGCIEVDISRGFRKAEDGKTPQLELSLTLPYFNMLSKFGGECKQMSTIEAYSL